MARPGDNLPKWPVRSFAPDLDSTTPGVLLDGQDMYPTRKGMRTLPSATHQSNPLPEPCSGAASLSFTSGLDVVVAGTDTTLNVWSQSSLVLPPRGIWITQDIGPLLSGQVARWRFAIFDDNIIAVDGVRPPFVATQATIIGTDAPWQPLANLNTTPVSPPIASLVASSDFSLFLVEPASATWWSTAVLTAWDTTGPGSLLNQTVTSTLTQTSGPITAAMALRSSMVLYKQNALFVGTLIGPPLIWGFTEISRQTGTVSQETLAVFRDVHYFLGPDDFYSFDGFSLNPLPNDLKEWFFQRIDQVGLQNVRTRVDTIRSCIFWHFAPLPQTGNPTDWICFNVREQRWSKGAIPIECAVDGPIVAQSGGTLSVTSGFIHDDHAMHVYGAEDRLPGDASSLTTGDIGDRHFMYQLTRVRPLYGHLNGLPTCTPLNLYVPGGTWDATNGKFVEPVYVPQATVPLSADGWFNLNNTARLQRLRIDHNDDAELIGLELDLKPVGEV